MPEMNIKYLAENDFDSIPAMERGDIDTGLMPLVSVLMLAFNHEAYIKEAIESVLSQRCDFPFELIIGEDCSRDRTRDICLDYQKRSPDKIRFIFSDENVGMHRNFARIWHRARGKYVAFLEGDDYWASSEKLAKQAALMEANPMFSMCGAYTEIAKQNAAGVWKTEGRLGPEIEKKSYSFEDLMPAYTFHFSSVMLRKKIVSFPLWFWNIYCVDRALYLLCAERGPAGFIPEVMSVYRHHEGGIWQPLNWEEKAKKSEHLFRVLGAHFDGKYAPVFRQALGNILWSYMAEAFKTGDSSAAKKIYWQSMRFLFPRSNGHQLKLTISMFIQLYLPSLYTNLKTFGNKDVR